MPTYEYKCDKCLNEFEQFQSITAKPLTTCSACGAKVRRVISSGAAIILKGSGFYKTDYQKKPDKPENDKKPAQCGKTNACASCDLNA